MFVSCSYVLSLPQIAGRILKEARYDHENNDSNGKHRNNRYGLQTAHGILREYQRNRQKDEHHRPEGADALIRFLLRLLPSSVTH